MLGLRALVAPDEEGAASGHRAGPTGERLQGSTIERRPLARVLRRGQNLWLLGIVTEACGCHCLLHVSGRFACEGQRLPGHRVKQSQLHGMQGLSHQAVHRTTAVYRVAHQRVTQPGEMDANLVGASGVELASHKAQGVMPIEQLQRGPGGLGASGVQRKNRHAQALVGVTPDRLIDIALRHPFPAAVGQREVFAAHLARGDGTHQRIDRPSALAHQHEARGVFVQPVDNAGPRQVRGTTVVSQQAVEQSPAPVASGRMNHEPGGFVDHQQIIVFMHHVQRHGLRHKGHGLLGGSQLNANVVSHRHPGRSLSRKGFAPSDCATVHQLLQVGTGEFGHGGRKRSVQAPTVHGRRYLELANVHRGQGFVRLTIGLMVARFFVNPRRYNLDCQNPCSCCEGVCVKLCSSLSAVSLCTLAAALVLSGCTSTPTDPTADWSPAKIYSEASDERAAGSLDKAISLYEKLEGRAAGTPLAQQAQLDKAYTHYKAGEQARALATIERFLRLHPASPALDYAYYLKGLVNFNENLGLFGSLARQDLSERDQKAAKESFESLREVVTRFPDSRYAPDARARMTYIVNSLAQYEVHVARYYHARGAHIAAINRAQAAVSDYANAPATEEALVILVRSYDALGMTQLRDDARRVLQANFPQSAFLDKGKASGIGGAPWWKLW